MLRSNSEDEPSIGAEINDVWRPLVGLPGFRRDVLFVVASLDGRNPDGTGIKSGLSAVYEDVGPSRLYQNLGALVDNELVDKAPLDGRTYAYQLTPQGRRRVEAHFRWERHCLATTTGSGGDW